MAQISFNELLDPTPVMFKNSILEHPYKQLYPAPMQNENYIWSNESWNKKELSAYISSCSGQC